MVLFIARERLIKVAQFLKQSRRLLARAKRHLTLLDFLNCCCDHALRKSTRRTKTESA